jgi:hypothetical protein
MKKRDEYETVWRNLLLYRTRGAHVVVKYIVTDENCSRREIGSFIRDVERHGRPFVLADIDHRHPDVNSSVLEGLAYMRLIARSSGIDFGFGETGSDSYPEKQIPLLVEKRFRAQWPVLLAAWTHRIKNRRLIGPLLRVLGRALVRVYEHF